MSAACECDRVAFASKASSCSFRAVSASIRVRSAAIDGTAGGGLTLRDAPSGAEIEVLPDGTILTLLEAEPIEANTFTWINVRTVGREEGWVVDEYLKIGECR